MTAIDMHGMNKDEIRAHILSLCRSADEFTAISNSTARHTDTLVLASICNATALALEKEHSGLFEELTMLANTLIGFADVDASVTKQDVDAATWRVLQHLETY